MPGLHEVYRRRVAGGGPLRRHVIREYVDEWVVGIDDYTPHVRKIYALLQSGHADKARRQLPPERLYPVSAAVGQRLLLGAGGRP